MCKEDSPIRGNVVEDDKRVTWLSAKLTEGLFEYFLLIKEMGPELKQKSPQKIHKNLSKKGRKPPEVGKNLTIKPFFNIIGFT